MYDLLIAGAEVADGTGAPLERADVAVAGGRIVAMGDLKGEASARTVDAGGLVLAPGFVDIHTHYDAQITWDPVASPSTSLGVTTVVSGNCVVLYPARPHPLVRRKWDETIVGYQRRSNTSNVINAST